MNPFFKFTYPFFDYISPFLIKSAWLLLNFAHYVLKYFVINVSFMFMIFNLKYHPAPLSPYLNKNIGQISKNFNNSS